MSEHCGTCRHYEAADRDWDWEGPFGSCSRIMDSGSLADAGRAWERQHGDTDDFGANLYLRAQPDLIAFTSDASGYSSTLHVLPDFGCVLHEPVDPTKHNGAA